MKKQILTIAILLIGIVIQAQEIGAKAHELLGQLNQPESVKLKTDYGNFNLLLDNKRYATYFKTVKIKVKITNENINYDSIMADKNISSYNIGNIWTDLFFEYEPVITKKFDNLKEAKDYYYQYKKSDVKVHREVVIYKDKKEKYLVGRFFPYMEVQISGDDDKRIGRASKFEIVNL